MKKLHKEIFVIENFLSNEEIIYLQKVIGTFKENDWFNDRFKDSYWYGNVCRFPEYSYGVLDTISERVKNSFKSDDFEINYFGKVHRMSKGDLMGSHYDNEKQKDLKKAFVIYLNNDFEGGELYFTDMDITINPTPGTLVTFPATDDYIHEVNYRLHII